MPWDGPHRGPGRPDRVAITWRHDAGESSCRAFAPGGRAPVVISHARPRLGCAAWLRHGTMFASLVVDRPNGTTCEPSAWVKPGDGQGPSPLRNSRPRSNANP